MKKRILSIILTAIMVVSLLPVTASAAGTYTITIDLNGGTLSNAEPNGWNDIGDGKYTKAYPQSQWAYFGDEWVDSKPSKEGYEFAGWLPDGSSYTTDSQFLRNDLTVTAKYNALIDVVVDPDGGTISAEAVPDGWTLSTDGKYRKNYPEETSSYSILGEWENVVPTYSEERGVAFIDWEAKDSWYYLSAENYIIQAKIGGLVDVTFDPDGAIVTSADPSWTFKEGKYVKKYPKGISLYLIQGEIYSAFTINSRKENYIFTNTFTCSSDWNVEDNTVYKPNFVQGYTLTVASPENGYILVDGAKVTSNREFFVPNTISISAESGILTINENLYGGLIETIMVEGYGNSGYELDSYTISSEAITGYISSIDSDKTISATFKSGTQNYPVWVDGEQFSADNLSMMDGKVSYNPDTQTLTLDGANISSTKTCAINFANNLIIDVLSDSVLSSTGSTRCVLAGVPYKDSFYSTDFYGSSVNLNITGNGKLSVNYESSSVYGSFISIGILAKNLTINTDMDVLCGDMEAQGYYDATYNGIKAGNTIINSSRLNIVAGRIYGMSQTQGFAIDGALVMNQADVKIDIQNVDTYSPEYYAKLISDKLTLNSGRFSGKMNPVGRSVTLSQVAILKEIEGAQEGATSSDLQFTQASASAPLILSTKDPVSVTGFSMTKNEYISGEAITYTDTAVVKKDSTDVTSSIDGYIYSYYKEDDGSWIYIGSQVPTDRGTYRLMVEVDDGEYYGVQELNPFTITSRHTITFNTNDHGTAPAAKTDVLYGSKIEAPTAPSCDGYTFGGWYKEESCTNEWKFETDVVTEDITLYAKWVKDETPSLPSGGGSYTPTPKMTFTDVEKGSYFYDAVAWAVKNKITTGVDELHFNPTGIASRAEMLTFMWRAAGSPEPKVATTKFTDIDPNSYYYKAVLWAVEKGITDGTSETEFSPGLTVDRAQTVTFLARFAGVKDDASGYNHDFTDVPASEYYSNAVAWAYKNKITEGTGENKFSPFDNCQRGQVVTFLYRQFAK